MNPAEVALAQLDVLLMSRRPRPHRRGPQQLLAPRAAASATPRTKHRLASRQRRRRHWRRRREHQPAAAPPAEPAEPEEQPAQLRCSKRLRVAPAPVAGSRGTEVEAL